MTDASKLERFSAGERFAVDPDAIERELASLWRAAGASSDVGHPVTRACLWNVVVHIEERNQTEGKSAADWLSKAVRDLPRYLAARALVLKTFPASPEGPELESWISANCILAGGGGKLVCSEEVAIAARGQGERHLPGLVRALLVPAVPTAVVFAGVPPPERPTIDALILAADRVVVYADHSAHATPLGRIRDTMARAPLGAVDLGWLGFSAHRSLIAALFDPPITGDETQAIDRVVVRVSPKQRWSAQLLLGWIAAALGAGSPKRLGDLAWRMSRPHGRALEAVLTESASAPGPSIELSARATKTTYAVNTIGETMAEISGPHISSRKPLGQPHGAGLLARALVTRSEDRAFSRALEIAGAM